MANIVITDQNFKQQVLDSTLPVIVDFWAPWCAPCKIVDPILDELSNDYQGKVIIGKINADENQQVTTQLNVMSMPTVMMFKNGQPIKVFIGSQGKITYQRAIEEVLTS